MEQDIFGVGKVVKVIDSSRVALNIGSRDGIKLGYRFILYELTEEIVDPETHEELGRLELVKGTGVIVNVQEKVSLLESDVMGKSSRVIRKPYLGLGITSTQEEIIDPKRAEPFEYPALGDLVKPV